MNFSPAIESFWQAYLATRAGGTRPGLDPDPIWQGGDTPEVATRLAHLTLAGTKTAASGLFWENEHNGYATPQAIQRISVGWITFDGMTMPP